MTDKLIRITDDDPIDAKSFADLAKQVSTVHCAKCTALIDIPGLNPLDRNLCPQCVKKQYYKQLLRPRTFYSGRVPYVNPKRQEKKAKKRGQNVST